MQHQCLFKKKKKNSFVISSSEQYIAKLQLTAPFIWLEAWGATRQSEFLSRSCSPSPHTQWRYRCAFLKSECKCRVGPRPRHSKGSFLSSPSREMSSRLGHIVGKQTVSVVVVVSTQSCSELQYILCIACYKGYILYVFCEGKCFASMMWSAFFAETRSEKVTLLAFLKFETFQNIRSYCIVLFYEKPNRLSVDRL